MRILHIDAFSGISGDMAVAALIDLGVDLATIEERLAALPLGGYRLRLRHRSLNGIRACKLDVEVESGDTTGHPHRSFRDIRRMLEDSALPAGVRATSLRIFAHLAEAEGKVHGLPAEEVRFHEVGAVDSIVDIVAAAVGVDVLAPQRVTVTPLPSGSGTVRSQHGTIPLPAPATVELLRGFPVRFGDGEGELVTPTGAAIVAALAEPADVAEPLRVERVGYGAGTRTLADRPNLLRLVLGEGERALETDEMLVAETNIDDANPELFEYVFERLQAAGARDVWLTPIQMKKSRPAVRLEVIADAALRERIAEVILRETTAIGVRFHAVRRLMAPREVRIVPTPLGPVEVKLSRAPDGTVHIAPEYESCARTARQHGVPLKSVYEAATATARQELSGMEVRSQKTEVRRGKS